MDYPDLRHVRYGPDAIEHVDGDRVVHRERHQRLPAGARATELHRRDVDVGLPEQGADRADDSRSIDVPGEQNVSTSRDQVHPVAGGEQVRGAGVVGEEPVLKPGERFEYTSGVPLPTSSGFMVGSYGMVTEAGEAFDIEIPAFSLDIPQRARTIN